MNKDLLQLIKSIRAAGNLDDLQKLKERSESVLRNQKRDAILTLLAISEELGQDEILRSLDDITAYLENMVKHQDQDDPSDSPE